jgi:ABC-2 type transport system ATP-binding protein
MELGEDHTILLSSHILPEVEQTCGRTIIISAGRIVASGSPHELRDQLSAQARVIAEMRGPEEEVLEATRSLDGVANVEGTTSDGWVRLAIVPKPQRDVRESLFQLTTAKGWSLRELRREGATLEDFFIQVTARQQERGTE